jgi:hypothetical protein
MYGGNERTMERYHEGRFNPIDSSNDMLGDNLDKLAHCFHYSDSFLGPPRQWKSRV